MWDIDGIATIEFHCLEYTLVPRQKDFVKLSGLHCLKRLGS